MLEGLATLLAFQLLGEALVQLGAIPVPGPVLGMALMFIAWPALRRLHDRLGRVTDTLLANFGLLFVPAGVGVMLHAGLIAAWWAPLLLGVVASSAVTIALGAWMFERLRRGRSGAPR
ncbi:MAG: CidA/LrgA family protein [Rubrivivax sp.]